MKNFKKRWTAWLLMFSLIFSATPVNALAYDGGEVEDQVIEIALGGTHDFKADLGQADPKGQWTSENSDILAIDEDGVGEALGLGETTVSFAMEKTNLGEAPVLAPVEEEQVTAPPEAAGSAGGASGTTDGQPVEGDVVADEGDKTDTDKDAAGEGGAVEPGTVEGGDEPITDGTGTVEGGDEPITDETNSNVGGDEPISDETNSNVGGDEPITDETNSNVGGDEPISDGSGTNEGGDEPITDGNGSDEGGSDEGGSDEGATDEGDGDEPSSDEGASDVGGSDDDATDEGASDEGATGSDETDGSYTVVEEGDELAIYTWTVRVYDPNPANYPAYAQLATDLETFCGKLGAFQEAYYAELAADSFDEFEELTAEAMTAFSEAAAAELGEDFNSLVELYKQLPARFGDEAAEADFPEYVEQYREFRGLVGTLANLAGLLGGDLDKGVATLANYTNCAVLDNGAQRFNNDETYTQVSGTHTLTIYGTWKGHVVVNGGTLTINGSGTIDGQNKKQDDGTGSVIIVKGGSVTLNGPTITGGTGTKVSTGTNTSNKWYEEYYAGGGVLVWQGTFTMQGGFIKNNTANKGGGVYVAAKDSCFIKKNQPTTPATDGTGRFYMNGGSIEANKTVYYGNNGNWWPNEQILPSNYTYAKNYRIGEGGGIWIGSTNNHITGGSITGNICNTTADWGGGGIYVNNSAVLYIDNAVITNNEAKGLGGGVSGCPHAGIALAITNGATIWGNTAKKANSPLKDANNLFKKDTLDVPEGTRYYNNLYVCDNRAGDYWAYNVFKDEFTAADAMDFYCVDNSVVMGQNLNKDGVSWNGKLVKVEGNGELDRYKGTLESVQIMQGDVLTVKKGSIGLTSPVKSGGPTTGNVTISGNYSNTHGGGIACNGALYLGTKDQKDTSWSFDISKELQNSDGTALQMTEGQFTFVLWGQDNNNNFTKKVATAVNDANGKVHFVIDNKDFLGSKRGKTYTFMVQEVDNSAADSSIKYDTVMHEVKVKVWKKDVEIDFGNDQKYKGTKIYAEVIQGKALKIVNTKKPGSLNVTKNVSNPAAAGDNWNFSFKVKLGDSEVERTGNVYTQPGVYTINVSKANPTGTITNIPDGMAYSITEVENSYYTQVGVVGDDGKVAPIIGNIEADKEAAVTVTNTRDTADLSVTKMVRDAGNSEERTEADKTNDKFVIEVVLGGDTSDICSGNSLRPIPFSGAGKYTITLHDGETATITGVPTGISYTVTELDLSNTLYANINGQDQIAKLPTNAVLTDDGASVEVWNEYYKPQYTDITVEKKFKGNNNNFLPKSIEVELLRDGKSFEQAGINTVIELNKGNDWQATWKNLPVYPDKTGKSYEYSVRETKIEYYKEGTSNYLVESSNDKTHFRLYKQNIDGTKGELIGGWFTNCSIVNESGKALITNRWHPANSIGEGSFVIEKLDADNGKPISGVTFKLINKNIPSIVYEATTEADGKATFGGLKPGTYTLEEIKVPKPYNTDVNLNQKFEVTIAKTLTKVEELEITDSSDPGAFIGTNNWSWTTKVDGAEKIGEIQITNTMVKGGISITKAIADKQGYINPKDFEDKKFVFNITGFDNAQQKLIDENLTVTTKVQNGEIVSSVAKLEGLAYGTYKITEVTPENVGGYSYTGVQFQDDSKAGTNTDTDGYWVMISDDGKLVAVTATNVYERYTGKLSVSKVVGGDRGDKDASWNFEIKLEGVTKAMNLAGDYALAVSEGTALVEGAHNSISFVEQTDVDGNVSYIGKVALKHGQTATISGLPVGTEYKVTEAEAGKNYYKTKAENEHGNILAENMPRVIFTNTLEEKDIPTWSDLEVKKVWANDSDHQDTRPASIEVELLQDGVALETVTLTADNNWQYKWESKDTKHFKWEVREVGQVEGYRGSDAVLETKTVNGKAVWEYTITNTFINPDEFVVEKVWVGDTPADRPEEITVQLYDGETPYGAAVVLTAANEWRHTWTELPIRRDWKVQEVEAPANYSGEVTYAEGKAIVTNTYHAPLTVKKAWFGDTAADRPAELTVQLYNGNELYDTVQLTEADGWSHTWTMLPLDGSWRVVEPTVPEGYHAYVSGIVDGVITVTNTLDSDGPGGDNPGGDEPGGDEPGGDNDTTIPDNDTPMGDVELPDYTVPLAYLPSEDDEEEILDEEIPLADVPTTGDNSGRWLALAMSSGLAGVWLRLNGRKRREESQD